MSDLKNKVAIVTGAGRKRGMGAAIANKLAQEGAHVVVADLCTPMAELPNTGNAAWETLSQIAHAIETPKTRCLPLHVDITDAASVGSLLDRTKDEFGRLDVLVNNAGAAVGPEPVLKMEEAAWRRTLEINATGTFLCCQKALPLLIASGNQGRIINTSSIAALRPKPFLAAYAASKAAILAFTRSLALEVAPHGITVNAVLPGDVDTDMKAWQIRIKALAFQQEEQEVRQEMLDRIPLGRFASPAEIACLVAYLASEEAAFITGQAYPITGGREFT